MTTEDVIKRNGAGVPADQWEFFKAVATGELNGLEHRGVTRVTSVRLPLMVHARVNALHEVSGLSFNSVVIQAVQGAIDKALAEVGPTYANDVEERTMRITQELLGDVEPTRTMRDGRRIKGEEAAS